MDAKAAAKIKQFLETWDEPLFDALTWGATVKSHALLDAFNPLSAEAAEFVDSLPSPEELKAPLDRLAKRVSDGGMPMAMKAHPQTRLRTNDQLRNLKPKGELRRILLLFAYLRLYLNELRSAGLRLVAKNIGDDDKLFAILEEGAVDAEAGHVIIYSPSDFAQALYSSGLSLSDIGRNATNAEGGDISSPAEAKTYIMTISAVTGKTGERAANRSLYNFYQQSQQFLENVRQEQRQDALRQQQRQDAQLREQRQDAQAQRQELRQDALRQDQRADALRQDQRADGVSLRARDDALRAKSMDREDALRQRVEELQTANFKLQLKLQAAELQRSQQQPHELRAALEAAKERAAAGAALLAEERAARAPAEEELRAALAKERAARAALDKELRATTAAFEGERRGLEARLAREQGAREDRDAQIDSATANVAKAHALMDTAEAAAAAAARDAQAAQAALAAQVADLKAQLAAARDALEAREAPESKSDEPKVADPASAPLLEMDPQACPEPTAPPSPEVEAAAEAEARKTPSRKTQEKSAPSTPDSGPSSPLPAMVSPLHVVVSREIQTIGTMQALSAFEARMDDLDEENDTLKTECETLKETVKKANTAFRSAKAKAIERKKENDSLKVESESLKVRIRLLIKGKGKGKASLKR